jgi:hypothetical protein
MSEQGKQQYRVKVRPSDGATCIYLGRYNVVIAEFAPNTAGAAKEIGRMLESQTDLLEACKQLVADVEAWNDAVENIVGRQPQTNISLDVAKAAIKRATEGGK